MRRGSGPVALLALMAACKPGAEAPDAFANRGMVAPAAPGGAVPPVAPAAPVGERMHGAVSPLTGTVSGFSVRVTDVATIVALDADVLFDFDKADLRPDARAALGKAADAIRGGGAGAVAIIGYTDAKGDDAYNLALSQRRAQAVAGWMREQPGVRRRDFAVSGKGEADPVAPNAGSDGRDDPAGRARNRRVEIVIPRA